MTTDPRSLKNGTHGWLTDSRVYNLVWLGRWLERFDSVSRMLGAVSGSTQGAGEPAAFEQALQSAAFAWGVGSPESDAGAQGHLAQFSELMLACLRNARDDATQVGSLELIRALNALLEEFGGVWDSVDGPGSLASATRYLTMRMDEVTAVCEQGSFRAQPGVGATV